MGPGLTVYHDDDQTQQDFGERARHGGSDTPRNERSLSTGHTVDHDSDTPRMVRRISADSFSFQRDFISHREDRAPLPTPPYTPTLGSPTGSALSPSSSNPLVPISPAAEENPAHTLEEFRNALRADLDGEQRS